MVAKNVVGFFNPGGSRCFDFVSLSLFGVELFENKIASRFRRLERAWIP